MSWQEIVSGALMGLSNFIYMLLDMILSPINPVAREGIIALLLIGLAIRLINDAPKIPKKIIQFVRRKDEDEYEWVQVKKG